MKNFSKYTAGGLALAVFGMCHVSYADLVVLENPSFSYTTNGDGTDGLNGSSGVVDPVDSYLAGVADSGLPNFNFYDSAAGWGLNGSVSFVGWDPLGSGSAAQALGGSFWMTNAPSGATGVVLGGTQLEQAVPGGLDASRRYVLSVDLYARSDQGLPNIETVDLGLMDGGGVLLGGNLEVSDYVDGKATAVLTVVTNSFQAAGDLTIHLGNTGGGQLNFDDITLDSSVATFDLLPRLFVDRETGSMTLTNNTENTIGLRGYSILSSGGALDSDAWQSISENYDGTQGDGSVDSDDWMRLTEAGGSGDLSEFTIGSAGFMSGQSIDLGNGWVKSINEDVTMDLVMPGGEMISVSVDFIGNDGASYQLGDLDFDGDLDMADWDTYRANYRSVEAGLSAAQSYQVGDLNSDGENDSLDFGIFKTAYDAENGVGSFDAMVIPEPSSVVMVMVMGGLGLVRRKK